MKLSLKIFLLLIFYAGTLQAQEILSGFSALGRAYIFKMQNSPFPHPKRINGYSRDGINYSYQNHYDDSSTVVFIPKNFRVNFTVDIVFYFHGMRNTIFNSINEFEIIKQFSDCKKNSILILTETAKNAEDNCGGKFEDYDGFKNLVLEVLDSLYEIGEIETPFPGKILLAGHSGAYRIISNIIKVGGLSDKLEEIYIFDGLYGERETFFGWIKNSEGKFINIYTAHGGTIFQTNKLIEDLISSDINFVSDYEKNITPAILKENSCIFIYSESDHNGVIGGKNENFKRFLKSSSLDNR